MWGYYNGDAMAINEIYWFETREEVNRFVQLLFQRNMELYPDEPYMWSPIGEDDGMIIEVSPSLTPEEALARWFGEEN